jgi:hypothetical protein
MALSPVSLTLKQKIFVISKNLFLQYDEKTDMILVCGKNSVAAAVAYTSRWWTLQTPFTLIYLFYIFIYYLFVEF